MPSPRRSGLRRRARNLALSWDSDNFQIFHPNPDDPFIVDTFEAAAVLGLDIADFGTQREALVLLDEQRRVTAMLIDPPAPVGLLVARCAIPGVDMPFCQTIDYVLRDHIDDGPPEAADQCGYWSLRRLHMLQGLQLLDVIMASADRIQSLSIACDPDPIWFEPFEPVPYHADA